MKNKPPKNHIRSLFYQGKYSEILAQLKDEPLPLPQSLKPFCEEQTFKVGALAFLGKQAEANHLFQCLLQISNVSEVIIARLHFFLAIAAVRNSQYLAGKRHLAEGLITYRRLRARKKILNSGSHHIYEVAFYAFQGLAFFEFFRGRYTRAEKHVETAYQSALSWEEPYGLLLSKDLLAHVLSKLGKVKMALSFFQEALQIAIHSHFDGNASAIEISIVLLKSQTHIGFQNTIAELEKALTNVKAEDIYSRSELRLELANQLFLHGFGVDALKILENASDEIYKFGHRRQKALLHLRLAHFLHLKGDFAAAKAVWASQFELLDVSVDAQLLASFRGLNLKMQLSQGESPECKQFKEFAPITSMDARILSRTQEQALSRQLEGMAGGRLEDPFGDLMDDVYRDPELSLEIAIEKKLFGLVPICLKLPLGSKAVIIRAKNQTAIFVSLTDVAISSVPLTRIHIKLLETLAIGGSVKTKEYLVEHVWGVRYRQHLHERTLQASLSRLRKLLGIYQSWLQWSPEGYCLSSGVRLIFVSQQATPSILNTSAPSSFRNFASSVASDLPLLQNPRGETSWMNQSAETQFDRASTSPLNNYNYRQLKFLKSQQVEQFISVSDWANSYNVSIMTAFRDLNQLVETKLVKKVGKGRATRYVPVRAI